MSWMQLLIEAILTDVECNEQCVSCNRVFTQGRMYLNHLENCNSLKKANKSTKQFSNHKKKLFHKRCLFYLSKSHNFETCSIGTDTGEPDDEDTAQPSHDEQNGIISPSNQHDVRVDYTFAGTGIIASGCESEVLGQSTLSTFNYQSPWNGYREQMELSKRVPGNDIVANNEVPAPSEISAPGEVPAPGEVSYPRAAILSDTPMDWAIEDTTDRFSFTANYTEYNR
jgi:hypothetical protein